MLLHVSATPTCNKDGSSGPKQQNHKHQLQHAAKLFRKYGLSMSAITACAADHRDGGFVALVRVGNTSHHSLVEFKDVSEGDSCWERRLLISREKMKEGSATELSQPLLFDATHLQQPSPGQPCIFRGKMAGKNSPQCLLAGMNPRTNRF